MAVRERNGYGRPRAEDRMTSCFSRDFAIPGLLGEAVSCDIFAAPPRGDASDRRAALVFVHGGGFVGGSKDQFLGAASWLALTTGAICVTMQYHVAPRAVCPAQIVDCLSVFQWLWDNRRGLRLCPELVFVVGGSPGAAIAAAAIAAGKEQLQDLPLDLDRLFRPSNGIFLNGIYDLPEFYRENPSERERVLQYLGCSAYEESLFRRYSPLSLERAGLQIRMLHGELDTVVPLAQCERMKRHLEACHSQAVIRVFPGKGHAWFNLPEEQYDVLKEIQGFIKQRKSEVSEYGAETAG